MLEIPPFAGALDHGATTKDRLQIVKAGKTESPCREQAATRQGPSIRPRRALARALEHDDRTSAVTDRIRIATPQDHDVVHEIVQHAYSPWVDLLGTRPAPMDAAYAELIADGAVHVTGAPIVGVIVLVPEEDALLVDNVAVAPAQQRKGTGRRLLAFAEAEACRLGLDRVRLFTHEAMTSNVRLYQRLGYEIAEREALEKGHLVHLTKPACPHLTYDQDIARRQGRPRTDA